MKTIKANNYDQVLKELEAMGAGKDSVKNEINECDSKMYHIVGVRIEMGEGLRNKAHFRVMKYHRRGYEKAMRSSYTLGFYKMILLHDPNLKEGESAEVIEPKKQESQEDVEKRIQAEVDRRVQAQLKAREEAEAKAESEKEQNGEFGQAEPIESGMGEDYWGKTVEDMKNFANDEGIDITGLKKKDDIKGAILAYLAEKK